MQRNYNKNKIKTAGFTLIEVMVSVTLFAIVMTLSLGAILSIIDGNKKAQSINSVSSNLNFTIESMVRDIKTGYAYTCDLGGSNSPTIPNPGTTIPDIDGDKNGCSNSALSSSAIALISTITGTKRGVKYYLQPDPVTQKGRIYKTTMDTNGTESPGYPVTSPEVDIQKMDFYVDNPISSIDISASPGQPKIFLVIKGTATVNANQVSDFAIQTLISQRNLNLPTQ